MTLRTENMILIGALVGGAVLMLYLRVYASQALVNKIKPDASVVKTWLQGIARSLK